jgi:acetyltransferase-like isoleucine patch superfamily enzyme
VTRIKKYFVRRLNLKNLSFCGENSDISGLIDKRHKNSILTVGMNCLIEGTLVTETEKSRISIGNNVYIGGYTILDCAESIIIEDDVLISYQCILADTNNHSLRFSERKKDLADWRKGKKHDWNTTVSKPIQVKKGAWIGLRAVVLKGVTIGEGAIVGAGSVVIEDVPDWTIVAGNPARIIREIPVDER